MNDAEYLMFSSREQAEIDEKANEIKTVKLGSFFLDLLAKGEFDYIVNLVNKKIPFYSELDTLHVLEKTIKDMSDSLFHPSTVQAIEHIRKIEKEEYKFIKESFIKFVVENVDEIEGLSPIQFNGSRFHKRSVELGLELLAENPKFVELFKGIKMKEFETLTKAVELEAELGKKPDASRKIKI